MVIRRQTLIRVIASHPYTAVEVASKLNFRLLFGFRLPPGPPILLLTTRLEVVVYRRIWRVAGEQRGIARRVLVVMVEREARTFAAGLWEERW
jgi:hypothetical protein